MGLQLNASFTSLLFIFVAMDILCLCTGKASYDGFCLYHVTPDTQDHVDFLDSLHSQKNGTLKIRFWHPPKLNHGVEVLVAPESKVQFQTELTTRQISNSLVTEDFQKSIDSEKSAPKVYQTGRKTFKDNSNHRLAVENTYLDMNEIDTYMKSLANDYANIVELEQIGTTYEHRPITVVKVGNRAINRPKQAIWIDSGIHAREWIAPAVGLYMLNKLVTNYNRNVTIRNYVDNINWYFVPVMNPDGYDYTHNHDRMWRKNRRRSLISSCTASFFDTNCCEGVDLNRNFGYHWGGIGASADPCDETYRGPSAFSEPESKAVRDFLMRHENETKALLTMHSYSQMWFYPYGDRRHSYSEDKDELAALAVKATNALRSLYGTVYKVGTAADILYESSGGSDDWAKAVPKIKYVYGLELRPTESSNGYGFVLPDIYIKPTGEETFAAVCVIADEILAKYYNGNAIFTTVKPTQQKPPCNNKSSSCWWFSVNNYCHVTAVQQLCRAACRLC